MFRRVIIVLSICIFGLISPTLAETIGKIVGVDGSPSVSGPSGQHKLVVCDKISENDKITVTTGNAQVLFVDGTKLVVGPGSSLTINKYLMQGGGSTASNFSIKALRGTFRFITGQSPKSAYNIQTANATIGIRGTGFDFWVNQFTGVAVLKGKVKLCNKSGGRACVNLNQNCELGTTENGGAKKVSGENQGLRLRNHLPFILNQSRLIQSFRLDVKSCQPALDAAATTEGNNKLGPQYNTPRKDSFPISDISPGPGRCDTGGPDC